jgi:hypothetical protein
MAVINLCAKPSQPLSSLQMWKLKKGKMCFAFLLFVYRFLSISTITAPTTAIAMIMPIVAGTK